MNKLSVISVYDKKTGLFGNISLVRRNAEAQRDWEVLKKDPTSKIGMNPEDFDLYQIGEYNDEEGSLTTLKPHIQLGSGL